MYTSAKYWNNIYTDKLKTSIIQSKCKETENAVHTIDFFIRAADSHY